MELPTEEPILEEPIINNPIDPIDPETDGEALPQYRLKEDETTTKCTIFYSSDASSPHKPELNITYNSGINYGVRPFDDLEDVPWSTIDGKACKDVNCMGYAFDKSTVIDLDDLGLSHADGLGLSISGLYNLIYETTLEGLEDGTLLNQMFGTDIASYNSAISSNQFRVVIRVGFDDKNDDGVISVDNDSILGVEAWDYHLWYQTNTGQWAEKQGRKGAPQLVSGTSGTYNPGSSEWIGPAGYNYTSQCGYYAMNYYG